MNDTNKNGKNYCLETLKIIFVFVMVLTFVLIILSILKISNHNQILSFIPDTILGIKFEAIFLSLALLSFVVIFFFSFIFSFPNKLITIDFETFGARFGRELTRKLRKQFVVPLFALFGLIVGAGYLFTPSISCNQIVWTSTLAIVTFASLVISILVLQRVEKPINTMEEYIDSLIELINTADTDVTIYCATHNPGQRDASDYRHGRDYKGGVKFSDESAYNNYSYSILNLDENINLKLVIIDCRSLIEFCRKGEDEQKTQLNAIMVDINAAIRTNPQWQPNDMLYFLIKFAINDRVKKVYPQNLTDTDDDRLKNLITYLEEAGNLLQQIKRRKNTTIKYLNRLPKAVIAFNNSKAIFAPIHFPHYHELQIQGVEILDINHIEGLSEIYKELTKDAEEFNC